jgi:GT2 family glycosyltransferase
MMGGTFPPASVVSARPAGTEHGSGARPSLCIVNFNGAAFLKPTIEAALAERGSLSEILFVDNGSSDDSLEIAGAFEGVRIVALGENRGAAAVRNAAIRLAASDLILLVDSDVRLAPGCAEALAGAMGDHPGTAIAMPRVLYEADHDTVQYDGADWHFIGLQIIEHRDTPARLVAETIRDVGSVITACCMIDRVRVGFEPFDEDYFIYLEDYDFGVRARLFGHRVLSVGTASCFHDVGTPDLSIRALGAYSSLRVFCYIRNRWQFMAKNYEGRTLATLFPLLAFFEVSQFLVALKKGWTREWFRAAGWMIRHAPDVIRRRREVQGARKLRDRDLIRGGAIPFREELTSGGLERRARDLLNSIAGAYWRLMAPTL